MERLTIRNDEGIGVLKHPYQCERCGDLQWSLPDLGNGSPTDRLAEYEDIGLTPEQIREIDKLYAEKCKEMAELEKSSMEKITSIQKIGHTDGCSHEQVYCFGHLWGPAFFKSGTKDYEEYLSIVKRLAYYEDLEEQGKLLKLPCAVGDTVYTNTAIQGWHLKKKDRPYEVKVVFIGINGVDNCMHVAYDNGCMSQFWFSEIGKTIFLTREEAEVALKEGGI